MLLDGSCVLEEKGKEAKIDRKYRFIFWAMTKCGCPGEIKGGKSNVILNLLLSHHTL